MIARKYTKRISILKRETVQNEFGGSTFVDTLLHKAWAQIKTASNVNSYSNKLIDLGIKDPTNTLIINVRHRNDVNYSSLSNLVRYNGKNYIIQNAPNNINLDNVDVQIIATLEANAS